MAKAITSLDGTPIEVRAIIPDELDRVVLRCWPEREVLERLFEKQGTIGIAAWEGEKCVAQLHCYRVTLPDPKMEDWPVRNSWWENAEWRDAVREGRVGLGGPVWCHACCHVGRTLETYCAETVEKVVLRMAKRNGWERARMLQEIKKQFPNLPGNTVGKVLDDVRGGVRCENDPRYFGRGIGTAMCKASVQWARDHDSAAVLAPGAPDGLFEFAAHSGHLPWTTYTKLGFQAVAEEEGKDLPKWAKGDSPPQVMAQVREALAAGRPKSEIRERLMLLDLRSHVDPEGR